LRLQALSPLRQVQRIRAVRADIHATRARADQLAEESGGLAREVAACRSEIAALGARLDEMASHMGARHERIMHALRMVRDDDAGARAALWKLRETPDYERAFEEDEPLVTIVVSTYRNWPMLRERCLPSILDQTYERFEAIVVGDAAPPEAEEVVNSFADKRLRFVNLPYNGPYPENPTDAWLVSGTTPWNTGLALAKGRWIGSNSDDDALRPNYVESLLKLARTQRTEVPYGQILLREPDGKGRLLGAFPPKHAQWGCQCALLHAGLRFMPMEPSDWLFGVPNDSSLLERMLRIGVRFAMIEEPVVDYYPSTLWTDRLQRTES
jgi:Glycosyl transferase family 2